MRHRRESVRLAVLSGLFVTAPALTCCATSATLALESPTTSEGSCSASASGGLIVYSATYSQTLEQSEYPAHTNYTVSTVGDEVIERVANNTGSFGASPAAVQLPCGHYHVRAQYGRGRYVIVPVAIQAGKTTVVDLDGEPLPSNTGRTKEPIRLPDGEIAGWRETIG
jgi:hypothetical protein